VSLADLRTRDLLDRIASSDPTPGGGSAAALGGAVAAALVTMVASMPKTRTGADDERRKLDDVRALVQAEGERLRGLVDEDAAAYDAVIAARRLPKETDAEKAARKEAMSAALRHAADVPMRTARASLAVLQQAVVAAEIGNPNARSDAVAAAALAWGALVGALENVRINVGAGAVGASADAVDALAAAGRDTLKAIGL
jgi:formiminotetrahydrofolate cyclodeaminase